MKACILAAGQGSRMGRYGDHFHKALLPLRNQAILSHIFARFPHGTHFVIALGHRGEDLVSYVRMAHPDLEVTWVWVERYTGPGSGPGQSLFECRHHLQEPFFFIACDTLIQQPLPENAENWLGVMPVADPEKWCTVALDAHGRVTALHYKKAEGGSLAFTGIARVEDYGPFWAGLEEDARLEGDEKQVNSGLARLATRGLKSHALTWKDAGTLANYEALLDEERDNYTFKGKITDATYHVGERVIKFFPDADGARSRFHRGAANPESFARTLALEGRFFSYRYVEGEMLSSRLNRENCRRFLDWAEAGFWRRASVPPEAFQQEMVRFYRDKSLSRLRSFCRLYLPDGVERPERINELPCAPAEELVAGLAPGFYARGLPSTFHGDLHADNIVCTPEGFRLIDWRDAFGLLADVGDRYYDLAKFLHVLELSVETMNAGSYAITRDARGLHLDHAMTFGQLEAQECFWEHVRRHGYDPERIRITDALIFINMSPLYDAAMGRYLYFIGRYLLQRAALRGTPHFS
ncbi:MAG: NTP transferase domain-containing protein [Magnetococcales bacterium]|nr:NTP transferase domain-containing protein [Magnetococcales bacterium]